MLSHTVEIDTSERPSRLRFAPNFNVAVPFVDRHISEGRGAKIAIRTSDSARSHTPILRPMLIVARPVLCASGASGLTAETVC